MLVDKAVDGALSVPAARHEPAITKQSQLVAHAGLADAGHFGQIAHAELTDCKRLKDPETGWVAQGGERIRRSGDHGLSRKGLASAGDGVGIDDRDVAGVLACRRDI